MMRENIKRWPFIGVLLKWIFLRLLWCQNVLHERALRLADFIGFLGRRFAVDLTSDRVMRQARRNELNKLCDISDWNEPWFRDLLYELREPHGLHRKAWEHAQAIHGLTRLGCVHESAVALSVGAGHEKGLYYFANKIQKMIGTDLYEPKAWSNEGDPEVLTRPEQFAPFPYREDHLQLLRMDGTKLSFDAGLFDFAYTLSSIEHFGGHERAAEAMREIERILKPGGIACIVTEYIINSASHDEYFSRDNLLKYIIHSHGMKLVESEIDWRISRSTLGSYIDLGVDPVETVPYLVLKKSGLLWTSIVLFFRKNPAETPPGQEP